MKRLLIGLFGKAAFILAVLLTGSLPAQAESDNPFGFETNKDPGEYEYCEKQPPGHAYRNHGYSCTTAPRPHPDFKWYHLQFVKEVGLCRIQAGTDAIDLEMEIPVKDQIMAKYGSPTKEPKQEEEKPIQEEPAFSEEKYAIPEIAKPQTRRFKWSSEEGFQGVGDVKALAFEFHVGYGGHNNHMFATFWLVTFDECVKAIDDKARRAF